MAPKFGTSGLRGLVTELTPDLIAAHVRAFLATCPHGGGVHVGQDLRPSSPDIAAVVLRTVQDCGLVAVDCGVLPTPALALSSMTAGQAAVMVTGSHIPVDRNGLKFYVPAGEIGKADEARITAAVAAQAGAATTPAGAASLANTGAGAAYADRYARAFGPSALAGLRIGIYRHSSVARDIMEQVVTALGATAVPLGHSDSFIPVDTEALDPATRTLLSGWIGQHGLDAVISTDGDADRPMLADADGRVIAGDVLGALTARFLGARVICTPVSSNGMVDAMGFGAVRRTRIGSPFVIAAMEGELAADPATPVVGYEANGGFLLGFDAQGPAGPLAPLMTRDCLLPMLAPLAAARSRGLPLAALVADLPPRFTAADRLTGIETDRSGPFLTLLSSDAGARAAFFDGMGAEATVDLTDGLRVTFAGGDIVHLRPSGNAPEFRCYAEAASPEAAQDLMVRHLQRVQDRLG